MMIIIIVIAYAVRRQYSFHVVQNAINAAATTTTANGVYVCVRARDTWMHLYIFIKINFI